MELLRTLYYLREAFVGNNCVIKNSIILNDVYLGDNTYIENCIVESRGYNQSKYTPCRGKRREGCYRKERTVRITTVIIVHLGDTALD